MQLTESIAEQIVLRTIKIIKLPVNVMDKAGVIIASSDKNRLYDRHEGALVALNENRIVEIDIATAKMLRGVKPGINLPITFQHNSIGVIGISGIPNEIRHYGELLKMTTELILEQAELVTQIQWSQRHKEDLILQLACETELNEAQLHSITQRLNIAPDIPRIASIIKVATFKKEKLSLAHLQQLVHLLEYPERDNLVAISSVSKNELLVLKPITLIDGNWSRLDEEKRVNKLFKRIAEKERFTIRIALGAYFPGLKGLQNSFLSAKATLDSPFNKGNVLFYEDHILSVCIHGLKGDPWRIKQLQQPISKLINGDSKKILIKTLTIYFENNCDINKTCEALYIHRNTLRYRIEKIEAITSLNLNKIDDKTRLYLSLLAL